MKLVVEHGALEYKHQHDQWYEPHITRIQHVSLHLDWDRGVRSLVTTLQSIIVESHRTETREHLILRVLAWCLFHDDELRFAL